MSGRPSSYDPAIADIDIPESLIALERAAWAEQQAGALTVETAAAVQQAITEHAKAAKVSRYKVETAVKKLVRHPEPEPGA
ncbi:hypothetical protein [Streptomyces sp. SR-10]|uniref:hypothetical protein n=1 Tax=Streptomyces sp. SR-10 TaxID=3416442 RepID=UPI003CEF0D32